MILNSEALVLKRNRQDVLWKNYSRRKIEYEMYDENGNLISSSSSSTIDSGYKYFAIRNE